MKVKGALGFIVGYALCGVISLLFWPNTDSYKAGQHTKELMKTCESKLPRDEFCVIVAVPSKENPQ